MLLENKDSKQTFIEEEIRNRLQLGKDKTLFLNCICSLNLNEWNGKQYKQIIMNKDFEVNEIDIFG